MPLLTDGLLSLDLSWLAAFKKRKAAVNGSWRMDETYIKIKGKWYYQYRAVDKYGATVGPAFRNVRNTKRKQHNPLSSLG